MKSFFRKHPETLLIGLAIIFLAFIGGLYSWGINNIIVSANNALNKAPTQQEAGFDLDGASQLDWHGLAVTSTLGTVTSSVPIPIATSSVTSSTR